MLHTQLCCVHYTAVSAKNSMKSIPAIHPAITENIENVLVKRMPQSLIIGKPISQYASNISKEQHEKHLCNPSSHYGKYEEYPRETCATYLDM